jgi:hypothetical protein
MNDETRPFLTLVTSPEGADREEMAHLLAEATGHDAATLRMRLGQAPPMILGQFAPQAARRAVAAITRRGGDAFAPTLQQIAALGPTLKVRDLRIGGEGVELDLWRGPSTTITPQDIQIIIRAGLSEQQTPGSGTLDSGLAGALGRTLSASTYAVWGMGGSYGWAVHLHARGTMREWQSQEKRIVTSHKLDFHTADGRVFQIDGDKFGYGILGSLRGYSDNENIDRMCELFVHLNPEAVVDPYFRLFRPPPGYQRLRLPDMKINRDDPVFAFYSRWAALMYRHVMEE